VQLLIVPGCNCSTGLKTELCAARYGMHVWKGFFSSCIIGTLFGKLWYHMVMGMLTMYLLSL